MQPLDDGGRHLHGAVDGRLGAVDDALAEHDAHAADVEHLEHVLARLAEEVGGAAVDLHPAADLVDQRQFLVRVGELAGERVELLLEAVELDGVARHRLEHAGRAEQRLAAVRRQRVGGGREPAAVEAELRAAAQDVLGQRERVRTGGQHEHGGDLPLLGVRDGHDREPRQRVGRQAGGGGDGQRADGAQHGRLGRLLPAEQRQRVAGEERLGLGVVVRQAAVEGRRQQEQPRRPHPRRQRVERRRRHRQLRRRRRRCRGRGRGRGRGRASASRSHGVTSGGNGVGPGGVAGEVGRFVRHVLRASRVARSRPGRAKHSPARATRPSSSSSSETARARPRARVNGPAALRRRRRRSRPAPRVRSPAVAAG
ncbi:MAG: hypothetical protein AVDCRST_MAG64-2207 [uncultured Phycisphaerae bacterium]|uniref:Uncharacterized protein n=1 Tax=uncultured Phycisphaerae bacterium TaxID=904963 RepID=A0A6J4PGQ6_9BACT|nr:MAG: hypothetical protein AVDCRST_MAG64-2207 [uncultured Phycisphaerae bacterium]